MRRFNSIIILLPFFGKLPWYIDNFICSCRYNSNITFCILTDNPIKVKNKPQNVFFLHMTLNQIQRIATEKLEFSTTLIPGNKICDFRPSLGFLFPELIQEFSFWGYGDIDVIYGNLKNFLTDTILKNYDIISFRPEYLTGSFTVYRNSNKINSLFMKSKDFRLIFSCSNYFNFDECNFLCGLLQTGLPIDEIPCEIDSMTHVVRRKHNEGYLNAYFDFHLIEGPTGKVKWEKGKIIYGNRFEAALYHFLKFKDICKNKRILLNNGAPFCISENTIYKKYKKKL